MDFKFFCPNVYHTWYQLGNTFVYIGALHIFIRFSVCMPDQINKRLPAIIKFAHSLSYSLSARTWILGPPSVPNWGANSYSNILKGTDVWITKMHDSQVGVVAFHKISACLLCTFLAFLKTCRLMVFSTILDFFCKIHIK